MALWEGTLEGLKQSGGEAARVAPVFNRAVLFRTSGRCLLLAAFAS